MILATDKIKIPKGGMELTFTIDEFQKIMLKQGLFVEFISVHDLYKEKHEDKEKYKTYIQNCDRIIQFIDENTDELI